VTASSRSPDDARWRPPHRKQFQF